jgi:hypothetical protein
MAILTFLGEIERNRPERRNEKCVMELREEIF